MPFLEEFSELLFHNIKHPPKLKNVSLDIKGFICHFTTWQIHPFISKGWNVRITHQLKTVLLFIYFDHLKLEIASELSASNLWEAWTSDVFYLLLHDIFITEYCPLVHWVVAALNQRRFTSCVQWVVVINLCEPHVHGVIFYNSAQWTSTLNTIHSKNNIILYNNRYT